MYPITDSFLLRALFSILFSFGIVCLIMPRFIKYLNTLGGQQVIREDGPSSHQKKKATPTMGGIVIVLAVLFSCTMLASATPIMWILCFSLLGFALIGGIDDYLKIKRHSSQGLPARYKLLAQSVMALLSLLSVTFYTDTLTQLRIGHWGWTLGSAWFFWGWCVLVGSSNAVNLTDGLDGLAIFPVVCVALGLAYLATMQGLPSNMATSIILFATSIAGAGLGFLWFNSYPAQIFMGDVGSLSLGAALGLIAIITHLEWALFVMGLVFVCEALSVIIQVCSYRYRKKRVFLMAPIHHHFELKGWSESKVIVRFWLSTCLCVVVTLILFLYL